jgi:hypothetical protein
VGRHEPARPDEELTADALGRAVPEDDALPRHRIGDRVYAVADHLI